MNFIATDASGIKKRALALLLCLLFALQGCKAHSSPRDSIQSGINAVLPTVELELHTSAKSAVLIDASDTPRILWEHNAHEKLPMASTTKIMTALVAAKNLPLSTEIVIREEAVGIEGSSVYLRAGEVLTLEALLYCLLLQSANDAAVAIATAVGGSLEGFSNMMNAEAQELGLLLTHFQNPHGLDADSHYTTAYELSLIAAEALDNEKIRGIFSTYRATVTSKDGTSRHLVNHNRLLCSYEGCIGVKTGYTKASGRCLVTAAERDGLELIAVTLDDGNDWQDHSAILDAGFGSFRRVCLGTENRLLSPDIAPPVLSVSGSLQGSVGTCLEEEIWITLPISHGEIECRIDSKRILLAPVRVAERVGTVSWYCDGALIAETNLITRYSAAARKSSFFGIGG